MDDFEWRLRECEMASAIFKRAAKIVDRVLPAFPSAWAGSREAATRVAVKNGWAAIDRNRARNRLHKEILPRVEAKVRAEYGRTSK